VAWQLNEYIDKNGLLSVGFQTTSFNWDSHESCQTLWPSFMVDMWHCSVCLRYQHLSTVSTASFHSGSRNNVVWRATSYDGLHHSERMQQVVYNGMSSVVLWDRSWATVEMYTAYLRTVVASHGLTLHQYADDCQVPTVPQRSGRRPQLIDSLNALSTSRNGHRRRSRGGG